MSFGLLSLKAAALGFLLSAPVITALPRQPSQPLLVRADPAPQVDAEVIVLGGGIAGIAAVRSLIQDYNITSVLLIEGRAELGGRAHTETLVGRDGTTTTVEKGCNWIQGPGKEPIEALAAKWGLQTVETDYDNATYFEGKVGEAELNATTERGRFLTEEEVTNFTASYDNFLDNAPGYSTYRLDNSLVDLSVRVATSIMDWFPSSSLKALYEYYNIDFTFAQSPSESSFSNAFGQEAGVAVSGDFFVTDQRGYKYIFVQEARELFGQNLSDPRLHLNTTVQTVDYLAADKANGTVSVVTDKGTFTAKHVISTFSLGVLRNQDVQWQPKFPDWKKEAIYSFAMAVYQKIFFLFEEQFWGDEQFMLYADPDERGRYAVWQNINAPGYFPTGTSTNVFMVTAVDEFARRNERLSDSEIQAEVMKVLREVYGEDISEPVDIVVPRWEADPFFRGSYSNWPLGSLDQHHENLRKPLGGGRLHFSGEAMSVDSFGYVQGAWDEGLASSATVAKCLLHNDCPTTEVYEALLTCPQQETTLTRREGKRMGGRAPARRHGHLV